MKRLLLLSLCLSVTLAACGDGSGESSMFQEIGKGMGIGGSAGAGSQAPATGAAKMLQDPEATESSTEQYVWADSQEQAEAMCQRTAERNGWRFDGATLAGGIALQTGKKRYTCRWTIFGEPNHDR